jgi:death-on-curing protein
MIESAIARPYTGYYRSIEKKAAALTESMARNHGFVDGNKRTTLILVHTLITKSGYELGVLGNDINPEIQNIEIEELILGAAEGMPFENIAAWFAARLRRV